MHENDTLMLGINNQRKKGVERIKESRADKQYSSQ